jgi:hypothetical protein
VALLIKGKKSSPSQKSRLEIVLGALLFIPFFALILSIAGALLLAMVFSIFSLSLHGLQKATGMILHSIFVDSIFNAFGFLFPTGFVTGLIAGILALLTSTRNRSFWLLGIGLGTTLGVTVLAYCVSVAYSVFQSALLISRWGCFIGTALGGLAGVAAGIYFARDTSDKGKTSSGIARKEHGAQSAELDWWRIDATDTDSDSDIDID